MTPRLLNVRDIHLKREPMRRGAAVVAIVVAMLLMGMIMIGMVMNGARDQELTVQRMNTLRSFYAAEGAVNMGIREYLLNTDEDGDGGIGSISNDADSSNDPMLGLARAFVEADSSVAGQFSLSAAGTAADSRRAISTSLTSSNTNFGFGFPFTYQQLGVINKQIATKVAIPMDVTLLSMTTYLNGPQTKETRFGFYNDSAGEPNALLAQSHKAPVGGNSAHFHWFTLPLPSTTISPGDYWLALSFENTSMEYTYDTTGGQTRYNNNDAVTNGYSSTWGSSTASSTRRVNIYTTAATETTGVLNMTALHYDNANPNAGGVFRDLTNPTAISLGNDMSSNAVKYSAINFDATSGTASDCTSAYDITPTTLSQTEFSGSLRVSGDVLVKGTAQSRWIGFAALVNETSGQEGIAAVLRENGTSDQLQVFRLPASGDISGSTALSSSSTFNAVSQDNWYRLIMDITIAGNNLEIAVRIYSHVTANNPNSAVNIEPLSELIYSTTTTALSGLQTTGEVLIVFDTVSASSKGSLTNFRIDSKIGTTSSAVIAAWSEVDPN